MYIKHHIVFASSVLTLGLIISPQIGFSLSSQHYRASLEDLTFQLPELWVTTQSVELGSMGADAPLKLVHQWEVFLVNEQVDMTLRFDRITGKTSVIEGEGIPWIPGSANDLTGPDLGLPEGTEGKDVPVDIVAAIAINFLKSYPDLFGIPPHSLQLASSSGPVLDYLYNISFRWTYYCMPVEKARLSFSINHGNMCLTGKEYIADSINKLEPNPYLTVDEAWNILGDYVGGFLAEDFSWNPGSLAIIPVSTPETLSGQLVPIGMGLDYRLVYYLSFIRPSVLGTWEGRVDAHSGELLSFRNIDWTDPMSKNGPGFHPDLIDLRSAYSEESECSCHVRPVDHP